MDDVYEYSSDEEVARYTSWPVHKSPDDSRAFLQRMFDRPANGQPQPWAMVLPEQSKVIGMCGLSQFAPAYFRADLYYALHQQFWGRGYAVEASQAVITWGFEQLGLNRIQAECLPENPGSERVMQKLGMQYEGLLREYTFFKGHFDTLKLYSILKKEWPR